LFLRESLRRNLILHDTTMSTSNPAKKIINDPLKCADELFEGLVLAYDGKARRRVGTRSIVMNDLRPDAPALLVGRGAGHEPIYHGLIGKGMADGAAANSVECPNCQ
jgi:phosphoenolpyruvate---glycerone phosphotransferase subunit DhaK